MNPSFAQTILTADEDSKSISVIDVSRQDAQAVTIVDAGFMPHNVQAVPKSRFLLATGMDMTGLEHNADGILAIYEMKDDRPSLIKKISVGKHAAHVIADGSGTRAYVSLSGENKIAVVDLSEAKIVKKIEVGAFPHGLRVSPDGLQIYVANLKGGSVSVIDVKTLEKIKDIPVGNAPVQVGFTPDGTLAFVSLHKDSGVALIETITGKVVNTIATGKSPAQVFADSKWIYVANQGQKDAQGDTISVIDWHTQEKHVDISVGKGPHGVVVMPDGKYVAVTNMYDNTVTYIDTNTLVIKRQWNVGRAPNGITAFE